jgi:hypothetical protein
VTRPRSTLECISRDNDGLLHFDEPMLLAFYECAIAESPRPGAGDVIHDAASSRVQPRRSSTTRDDRRRHAEDAGGAIAFSIPVALTQRSTSPMNEHRSCSWCHAMNRVDLGAPTFCAACGHRADVARRYCTCPTCSAARRATADLLQKKDAAPQEHSSRPNHA